MGQHYDIPDSDVENDAVAEVVLPWSASWPTLDGRDGHEDEDTDSCRFRVGGLAQFSCEAEAITSS